MKLAEITIHFLSLSNEDQLKFIREVRHRRTVIRPAMKKKISKAKKPVVNKAKKLAEGLTAAEQAALIKQLEDEL